MLANLNRRGFLVAAASVTGGWGIGHRLLLAGPRPDVTNPRATDGDQAAEPNWEEQLTISVGPKRADLVGKDDKVLQAALDYVARLGGGTVRVLPGTYTLRNSVRLPAGTRLLGSGADSVLTKIASASAPLSADSDWYDQEITLREAGSFRVGDGVVLRAKNPDDGSQVVIKATLVARSGNRFKLSQGLRKNLWLSGQPRCESLFPLLTAERTADVIIENLTLDGNGSNNENLDGNYAGGIFLQDCNRFTIRGVTSRNYNGDGISFQICHDVRVENCHCHDNQGLGLHPGSGSQRPLILNNRLQRNQIGLFWCWGVKFGLAEHNQIEDNRDYGISIGHNDTHNVMRNNTVLRSGKVGLLFRDDPRGQDFWANENTIEDNRIVDSGERQGVAIDIRGKTRQLTIRNNVLEETREPLERVGIRVDKAAGSLVLADNTIQGFAHPIVDLRRPE